MTHHLSLNLLRLAVLLLLLWAYTTSAATFPAPASPASGLLIGRVVVRDQRPGLAQPWSRINVVWQNSAGQTFRAEADHDALFLLANVEPGEYTLTRLMLVREIAIRGKHRTESLSLSPPFPWRVRLGPGAVLVAGELAAEIRADRTLGMSLTPLSASALAVVTQRLDETEWAQRLRVIDQPFAGRPDLGETLKGGQPQISGPDHVVLPYRGTGRSLVVEAAVNGRRTGRFLLDTGASVTVISRRLAREADAVVAAGTPRITLYTANGPVQAPLTTLASISVSGLEARDVIVAVHDLPGVGSEIDGLLGMSFLRYFKVTIDPDRRELVLDRR